MKYLIIAVFLNCITVLCLEVMSFCQIKVIDTELSTLEKRIQTLEEISGRL